MRAAELAALRGAAVLLGQGFLLGCPQVLGPVGELADQAAVA